MQRIKSCPLTLMKIIFISILLFSFDLYARDSFDKHEIDYYAVLGIPRDTNHPLEPLFKQLHEIIDQKGGNSEFIQELRDKYHLKFGGGKKHRYLFHWGFNQDIRQFEPLREILEEEISNIIENEIEEDGKPIDENSKEELIAERVDEVLEFINRKRNETNRELIQKCMDITGLPRNESAGLITILWDIHILADYTGKELEGLLPFYEVSIELKEKGINRLFEKDIRKTPGFNQRVKQVFQQLENAYQQRECGYINLLCGYGDCSGQVQTGEGVIAQLLRASRIIRPILEKKGIL